MEFETEEQKIEALKKWWKDNGKMVVAGLVIGGALIAGWRIYQDYRIKHSEKASALYEVVLQAAVSGVISMRSKHALIIYWANIPIHLMPHYRHWFWPGSKLELAITSKLHSSWNG